MEKYLYVEQKTVYGTELVYPICERSKTLAKLCGTKTLTEKHINLIEKLGYVFRNYDTVPRSIIKHLIDKKIIKESDVIKAEDYVSDEEGDAPRWIKPNKLEEV